MTHQEAADFAQKHKSQGKNAKEVAQALVREALDKKTEDNVTCVVVFFNWDPNATVPATAEVASSSSASEDATPPAEAKPTEEFGAFPPTGNQ
jgi:serine/threonine protein phosphatase PrpC